MTLIVMRSILLRDEGENVLIFHGNLRVGDMDAPTMIVRVEAEVGHSVARVVFAEEQLTRVVCQRDALLRDFEVNFSGCWQRPTLEQQPDGLANSLRSR